MTEQKQQEPSTTEEKSVAPSSNNAQTSGESKARWYLLFSYIASLRNDERVRFITAITIASLVLLGFTVGALLILVQVFDFGIDKGVPFFRPKSPEPTPTATSSTGAEPSGKLTLEILGSPQEEKDVFRRNWIGPEGEGISSNDLDPCLLVPGLSDEPRWGQLLAVVMREQPKLARLDPFRALADNGLKQGDLKFVSERTPFEAPHDGFLTFIINEAVFATPDNYKSEPYPQPKYCKDGYEALDSASKDLNKQNQKDYIIHSGAIPLIWYSDNIGSFQVIVRSDETKKLIARVMVDSTAGFQNSGIFLNKDEKVILEPDGRVHLALRQVHTFAGLVRPIIEREKARKSGG